MTKVKYSVGVSIVHSVWSGENDQIQAEKFCDMALGMFIHWSCDSALGIEISHPMIGAEERILHQYENELGPQFNPRRFDLEDYASLAEDNRFSKVK